MRFFKKSKKILSSSKKEVKPEGKAPAKTKRGRPKKAKDARERWFESEGKLSIDLYKSGENLVLQSTIAGVKPEDLEITIQGDIITIKGVRTKPEDETEKNYFHQECYWGPFSRQVVLPEEVDPSRAEASLEEGILTVKVPCIEREKKRIIAIRG